LFIYQEKGGYCYNSDTLFLYDFICKKGIRGNVLDVGCGCGILGLLIKESKQSTNLSKKISRFNSNLPIEDFIKKSNSLLKPRGELIFCYDVGHFQDIVYLLRKYKVNLEEIRFIHPKLDKNATIVLIRSKKSSKSMVKCLPPLVTHKNDIFNKEVTDIYKKINLKSLKCEMEIGEKLE